MKPAKQIKVGARVMYVDRKMRRGGCTDHHAKVLGVNGDGSLLLLVNLKSVGKVPFDNVRQCVGNDPIGWR